MMGPAAAVSLPALIAAGQASHTNAALVCLGEN
jgi:hypothetical protein